MDDVEIVVGDWICFSYNGGVVIGEVRYVRDASLYTSYLTDAGIANEEDVLEIRKKVTA